MINKRSLLGLIGLSPLAATIPTDESRINILKSVSNKTTILGQSSMSPNQKLIHLRKLNLISEEDYHKAILTDKSLNYYNYDEDYVNTYKSFNVHTKQRIRAENIKNKTIREFEEQSSNFFWDLLKKFPEID